FGRGRGATALGHEIVLRGVDRDSVQPCVKRTFPAKVGQCSIGLDERFLGNVLYLGRITDQARQKPEYLALVLRHQQLESALVAALYLLNQDLVGFAITHRRTQPGRYHPSAATVTAAYRLSSIRRIQSVAAGYRSLAPAIPPHPHPQA